MDDLVIIDGIEMGKGDVWKGDNPGEIWKDITGWAFHQVSNQGRVRVLPGGRIGYRGYRTVTEMEIKKPTHDASTGYMTLNRWNGKNIKDYVHRLVLEEFIGPCPPGQQCRHLNGDPSDNRLDNLEWGTQKENEQDKIRHGTIGRGEHHSQSKLTSAQVGDIKSRPGYRGVNVDLAAEFGVTTQAIWDIRNGRRWNHGVEQ